GPGREEDHASRRVLVEEVGRQIVRGGKTVGDSVPVDLAPAPRESVRHAVVVAEEGSKFLPRRLDVGRVPSGSVENDGSGEGDRWAPQRQCRQGNGQPRDGGFRPVARASSLVHL